MKALFAVPSSQEVIAEGVGLRWFIVIILIFWLATLIVANFLDFVFTWLRNFRAAGNSLWELLERYSMIVGGRDPRRHRVRKEF
jgi:hypothetical protein